MLVAWCNGLSSEVSRKTISSMFIALIKCYITKQKHGFISKCHVGSTLWLESTATICSDSSCLKDHGLNCFTISQIFHHFGVIELNKCLVYDTISNI